VPETEETSRVESERAGSTINNRLNVYNPLLETLHRKTNIMSFGVSTPRPLRLALGSGFLT
jgi:hypothetical protein